VVKMPAVWATWGMFGPAVLCWASAGAAPAASVLRATAVREDKRMIDSRR
jgi:hypothetical protein